MNRMKISLLDVARGLVNEEFVYYYQPKVSMVTGKLCGAEALLRWSRPDGTLLTPAAFIPLAETTTLITDIASAMFPRLMEDLDDIRKADDSLHLSFNLSAKDFESAEMVDTIGNAIRSNQLDPKLFQVELTETSIILNDNPLFRERLNSLHEMGIGLGMDDFGTGYSSINMLSKWPFTTVKIDQELVQSTQASAKSRTIVANSITLAHQLGMNIVAEGIESAELYDYLVNSGCTEGQGYWLGRPMQLAAYQDFIHKEHRWSGVPIGLIYMAKLEHLRWMRLVTDEVINAALDTEHAHEKVLTVELDPTRCRLGHWYYGLGQEFKGYPAFDGLEAPHSHLHHIARQLGDAVLQKVPHDRILALLHELSSQSNIVLALLQDLENDARFAKLRQGAAGDHATLTLSP